MSFLTNLLAQIAQQQSAPAPLPNPGTLYSAPVQAPAQAPVAPMPFQPSALPWNQQIANAIDYGTAAGDAWNTIGRDGVINYMGDSLMKKYGTNNLSDFRYIEKEGVPGGYQLDWAGRQPVTGLVGGFKDLSRSTGIASGAPAGDASDGSMMEAGNPADALNFGATWEGEGGTTFGFYRKPDGSVGIKTNQAQSNETGDIIAALAILGGGYMAGTGALGGAAGGAGAAEGAAAAGAAEGAAAGAAGGSTAAMGAGAADLGMAGFGQIGIPSAIPAGAGYGTLGTTALSAPVSTFGAGFGGGAIGSGLAGSLAAGGAGTATMGAGGSGGGAGGAEAITGTPPPANPYHPASYLNPTNLGNLATSGGVSSLLGPAASVLGAISGGKGQEGSSSSTKTMDPRMDALFYGDLAPKTQGLLSSTLPGAQAAGQQLTAKGGGLLGQTAPNTATNPYATGILDDMQRRQQELISRSLQQTKGNFVGVGGLGGSRQGIAEADAITRGADNFAGQGFNFMGGLYNADQNRLRQDWTLGAGLLDQGVSTPFLPARNAAQIYSPFTGFGTTTNDSKTGGGWQGAVGGALAGASFGRNMGWW